MHYFDITIPCQAYSEQVVDQRYRLLTLQGVTDNDLAVAIGSTVPRIATQFIRANEAGDCPKCTEVYARLDEMQEEQDALRSELADCRDELTKSMLATEEDLAALDHEREIATKLDLQLAQAKDKLEQSYLESASMLTDIKQLQTANAQLAEELAAYRLKHGPIQYECDYQKGDSDGTS
jgi:chromosome segregation ATPase